MAFFISSSAIGYRNNAHFCLRELILITSERCFLFERNETFVIKRGIKLNVHSFDEGIRLLNADH